MNTYPIIHMKAYWEAPMLKIYSIETLCGGDPWDDGHDYREYGHIEVNCLECIEIYAKLEVPDEDPFKVESLK